MPARTLSAFLIILTSVSLISCNDKSTDPSSGSLLIPLSDKNTWNYNGTWFDKDGIPTKTFTQTMTAAGPDTAGNFIGYKLNNCPLWIWDMIYTNKSDGLYLTLSPESLPISVGGPKKEPKIEKALAFPTKPGNELIFRGYNIKTKSIKEILSVPAGDFSCVVYEAYYGGALNSELYFAPGVGLVKLVNFSNPNKKVMLLTSYHIN